MLLIIQARSNSKRFPNKILYNIKSKPIILRVISNISKSKMITNVVVATSRKKSDDKLIELLKSKKLKFFRGNLNNVASRLLKASQRYKKNFFIRVSADSPLIDYKIINKAVRLFKKKRNIDIITNVFPRSYPKGQSVEIIRTKVLENNISKMSKSEKEHVTTYFYKNYNKFKILNFSNNTNKFKYIKNMTVDYKSDVKKIIKFFKWSKLE